MNLKAVAVTFLLFLSFFPPGRAEGGHEGQKDSSKENDAFVIVVPFKSNMYTATGDYFICKSSKMTPGELSEMARKSLASTLVYNLSEYFNTSELDKNTSADAYSDLSTLYKIVTVKYKKKRVRAYYKGYPPFSLGEILGPRYKRWGSDCVNNRSVKPNHKRHKYAEAHIINDSLFEDICARNHASYVLIITQFEMYTRFKNCLDLQENIFQRDFFVHFTIFTGSGREVDGGVVATTYQSTSNDARFILEENLGTLSGLVVDMCRKNFSKGNIKFY